MHNIWGGVPAAGTPPRQGPHWLVQPRYNATYSANFAIAVRAETNIQLNPDKTSDMRYTSNTLTAVILHSIMRHFFSYIRNKIFHTKKYSRPGSFGGFPLVLQGFEPFWTTFRLIFFKYVELRNRICQFWGIFFHVWAIFHWFYNRICQIRSQISCKITFQQGFIRVFDKNWVPFFAISSFPIGFTIESDKIRCPFPKNWPFPIVLQ